MTVYNKGELLNLAIQNNSSEALDKGYVNAATADNIKAAHPVALYMPNKFVAAGFAILTILIVLSISGLFALITGVGSNFDLFLVFIGVCCYFSLEYFTRVKKHYNSGVDNMLMALTAIFICFGISFRIPANNDDIWISLTLLLITSWFTLRFASWLAALVAAVCLLIFKFNLYTALGEKTIFSFPYILIIVSLALYLTLQKKLKHPDFSIYEKPLQVAQIVALFSFYFWGNIFIVEKITKEYYLITNKSALSWPVFFWGWTFLIPVIYVAKGIKDKDLLLLLSGWILVVVSIVTFRYYHALLPLEQALTIGGIFLITLSYWLMKFLRIKRHGFIYNEAEDIKESYSGLDTLIIAQAMPQGHSEEGTKFGGGSFGGAGAGSSY